MTLRMQKLVDGNVTKYIWTEDDAVYESVLYAYPDYKTRMVLCVSVQCGCPVGCTFCGTGKQFIRNLTAREIANQVHDVCEDVGFDINDSKKPQIMFMSMGEPFLNYYNVKEAIYGLYEDYPHADLLVSTIAPRGKEVLSSFMELSYAVHNIGLQFSIHESDDEARDELIPYKNKLSLWEIRNYGVEWWAATGRKVYLNYCVEPGVNNTRCDAFRLTTLFPPNVFAFTFSVICNPEKGKCSTSDMEVIKEFQQKFIDDGYDTRTFNPDGQDTIGGGCGQLWFVQDWMKKLKKVPVD